MSRYPSLLLHLILRIRSLVHNNPDYFGAIATGYSLVAVQIVAQIVLVPMYLAYLGTFWFGVLMVIFSITSILSYGMRWMQGNVTISFSEAFENSDKRTLASLYSGLSLVILGYLVIALPVLSASVLIFIIFFAGEAGRPTIEFNEICAIIFPLCFYFAALMSVTAELWILMALRRQSASNLFLILSLALSLGMIIIWVRLGGGIFGVLWSLAISMALVRVLLAFYRRRLFGKNLRWTSLSDAYFCVLRELRKGNWKSFLVYGMCVTVLMADVLIVGFWGGAIIAGKFVLVWKIPEVMILLTWRLSDHLKPEILRISHLRDIERLRRIYRNSLAAVFILSASFGLVYTFLGKFLVKVWVGDAVAPVDQLAFAFAGLAVFWLGCSYLGEAFASMLGQIKLVAKVKMAESILKIAIIVLLFPVADYWSPMIAVNLTFGLGLFFIYIRIGQKSILQLPEKFSSGAQLKSTV